MKSPQVNTGAFINGTIRKEVRPDVDKLLITLGRQPIYTTNSFAGTDPYGTVLPSNLNVFSNLAASIAELEDTEVEKQVRRVLSSLYMSLQKASRRKNINNYLSRLNLIQQEDKAALLEWSFQDFRVSFTLEPDKNESSYFYVSQDKSTGSFKADTQKLDADISRVVDKIVEYVLENT